MTTDVSLIPQNRVENLITDLASKQSASTAVTSVNNITPVNGNVSLTLPQVDQTYNSSFSNAQSGSAINGLDSTLVHKSGDETITGNKTFTGTTKILTPTLTKQNTEYEGGQIYFERSDSDVTMGDNNNPYIDFWQGKFRFIGQSSSQTGSSVNIPFSVDIQNNCLCYGNSMKTMSFVTETYISGTNWYRIWSDGWIEQGGFSYPKTSTPVTVTLLKAYSNTNYNITLAAYWSGGHAENVNNSNKTASSFQLTNGTGANFGVFWRCAGY